MKHFLLLSIVLLCFFNVSAQKKIKLTKTNSFETRIIKEGMRIIYRQNGKLTATKGILKTVDKTFLVVDDRKIAIEDLSAIGRKRGGSGFFQFVCGAVGAGAIISSIRPDPTPSCGGCQTTSTVDSGAVFGGVAIGVAIIAIGVNSGLSNSPRDLTSKWKLEIVDYAPVH